MSKLPIKTSYDGEVTTKICIEDFYKVLNRVQDAAWKAYEQAQDAIDSIHKVYDGYEGELIIGTGVSEPCSGDEYSKEIGEEIAFKKAKLNANIKKAKLLEKVIKGLSEGYNKIINEQEKIESYIQRDLVDLREYNPDYLVNFDLYQGYPIDYLV